MVWRAVETPSGLVMAELMVATVRAQVALSLFLPDLRRFQDIQGPGPQRESEVHKMLDPSHRLGPCAEKRWRETQSTQESCRAV